MSDLKHLSFQHNINSNKSIAVEANYDKATNTFPHLVIKCNWKDSENQIPKNPELVKYNGQWNITGHFLDLDLKNVLIGKILDKAKNVT